MSESEAERLARLETRADQQEKLHDEMSALVRELKTALDKLSGGKAVFAGMLLAASTLGGLIVKFLTLGGK